MMKKYALFLLVFFCISVHKTYGQTDIVSVNKFTGTANVVIPLFTVKSGTLSVPISISYSASGIKVKQVEGLAGMGWDLNAGGEISRDLRGLPDDCKKDNSSNERLGWLYNDNGHKINAFTILNDNNQSTCPDETTDINYINTNFNNLSDTEPDIFYVNAPGLSCSLVFDQDHNVKTIPYQDLKVSYVVDSTGSITSFSIIDDKGVKYQFSEIERATKRDDAQYASLVSFFKNDYMQYEHSISYTKAWKLSNMIDMSGNTIVFSYEFLEAKAYKTSIDSVNLILPSSDGHYKSNEYIVNELYTPKTLTKIQYGNGNKLYNALTFLFEIGSSTNVPTVSEIDGYGKTLEFKYVNANLSENHTGYGYERQFLESFITNSFKTYSFDYFQRSIDADGITHVPLPDSSSKEIDYWGYYNGNDSTDLVPSIYINPSNTALERYRFNNAGNSSSDYIYSISGNDRSANVNLTATGTLNKINYPDGGYTTLEYESNNYYDNAAKAVLQGGGIRIKYINHFDGINTSNNIVHSFSYLNPSTGYSSGKPISLPVYAFTIPIGRVNSSAEGWNYSTARSESNLSKEDNSIIYSYVRETQTGAGSTLSEYSIPATNWDTSFDDWNVTISNAARTLCQTPTFVTNDRNTYPFPPNTNYEFERGLLKKVTNFNDNGKEVAETSYIYQRTGPAYLINGLKLDYNSFLRSYAKYSILTSTGELKTKEVKKIYDSATLSQAQQTTTDYYFTGLLHKLPTSYQITNSDGSIKKTFIKYTKDYNAASASGTAAQAIYNLQQLNANIPVEQYEQVNRNGVVKTTNAKLIRFNAFNPGGNMNMYLPSQKMNFISANGVTDFQPSLISGGTFINDPRYFTVENDLTYESSGFLLSKDDNNKNVQSVLTDHEISSPVAMLSGARFDEIGFSDFDSEVYNCGFIKTNNDYRYSVNSRSGKNALSLNPSEILSRTLSRNSNAKNYIFSIWINSTAAGNVSISLTNSSSQVLSYSLPFINGLGNWKYYELKVPVVNDSGVFSIQFYATSWVQVDDVLFYPENAEVNTNAYDHVTHLKTSETNTNGVSKYYSYDSFNKLRYIYDQDKQIMEKKTYLNTADYASFNSRYYISLNPSTGIKNDLTNVSFSQEIFGAPSIKEGLVYTWDFGDGTPVITTLNKSQSHVFSSVGSYTVKGTVSSPFFGQRDTTYIVNVGPGDLHLHYSSLTGGFGRVNSVWFSQGGVLKYNFTQAQIQAGQIIPMGLYEIKVNFIPSPGIQVHVYYTGGSKSSGSGNPWTFTLDTSHIRDLFFELE